jgi:hypothetical protein
MTGAELRVLEAPHRYRYYATALSRDLVRRLDVPKPAIFFVDETLNRPAFDAEAIGLGNSATRPELANAISCVERPRSRTRASRPGNARRCAETGKRTDCSNGCRAGAPDSHEEQLRSVPARESAVGLFELLQHFVAPRFGVWRQFPGEVVRW